MTTKIGIDMPPELLEAARVNQANNRNKLSLREQENRINLKITRSIDSLDEDEVKPWKGAVPDYKPPALVFPKGIKIPFGWVAVEELWEYMFKWEDTENIFPQMHYRLNYAYSFAAKQTILENSRYFKDVQLWYLRGTNQEYKAFWYYGELFIIQPEKTILNKADFSGMNSETSAMTINSNTSTLLDFTIKKELSSLTQTDESIPRYRKEHLDDLDHYRLTIHCSIPKVSGSTFLYIVWKETGSESFVSSRRLFYNFNIYDESDAYLYNYNYDYLMQGRTLYAFSSHATLIGITKKIDGPRKANYPVFPEENLPEKFRGVMTVVFKVRQIENVSPYLRITFFGDCFTRKPRDLDFPYPLVAASMSLQERFLIFTSTKNYANL